MKGRTRRGSALILVLLMTLAVAALAVAAIYMSSSAGLLSRFYDREREYRLAAESALEIVRSRLLYDSTFVVPNAGSALALSGFRVPAADGSTNARVRVDVFAAATGDTTGLQLPAVTLIARAYDDGGTRHVRRMDLRRSAFTRFALFTHNFSTNYDFGPGTVHGPIHSNGPWRSWNSPVYRDSVTAASFDGSATFSGGSATVAWPIPYPEDSTYAAIAALGDGANLAIATLGGTAGTRVEFVAMDADNDGDVEPTEGFLRVFDLVAGDTTRLVAQFADYSWYGDHVVQNQCGAFYWINGSSRWEFFPVSRHRATWVRSRIRNSSNNYPEISATVATRMANYDGRAVYEVLTLPTARCFPAGSPYLMPSERMTTPSGSGYALATIQAQTSDTLEWGRSNSHQYGGMDTTFTPFPRTCQYTSTDGRCEWWSITRLGAWRVFGGTAVAGVSSNVRQAVELKYLWPLAPAYNPTSRRVVRVGVSKVFLSGTVAGPVSVFASGGVTLVDAVRYANDPNSPATDPCRDQLGLVAVGDILVALSPITRPRYETHHQVSGIGFAYHMGEEKHFTLQGHLMSLKGSVGVAGHNVLATNYWSGGQQWLTVPCPTNVSASIWASPGGCLYFTGSMIMRDYRPLWQTNSGYSRTGFRWQGQRDRCAATTNRPPFFPLTNRYTKIQTLEIEPSRANTTPKIQALLTRLKGSTL